jgi:hypothetical protein
VPLDAAFSPTCIRGRLAQYYRNKAKSHFVFQLRGCRRSMSIPQGRSKPRWQAFPRSSGGTSMTSAPRPATASEIIEIVGHLDDGVVARILATGATPAEVLEAFTWISADDQLGTELQHGRHGAVGAVYDILLREEPDPEELRR